MVFIYFEDMKKRAITDRDKERRGKDILTAARELFIEHGYDGTTVEMITRRAGISTGTFYLYYDNKIEVFKAIQDEGLDLLIAMVGESLRKTGPGAEERLTAIARTYLEYYVHYREYFDIMAVISAYPDELKEKQTEISGVIDGKVKNMLLAIERIIKEGIASGEFRECETWQITSVLWGLMDGLILLAERNNIENVIGVSLDELVSTGLESVLCSIRA